MSRERATSPTASDAERIVRSWFGRSIRQSPVVDADSGWCGAPTSSPAVVVERRGGEIALTTTGSLACGSMGAPNVTAGVSVGSCADDKHTSLLLIRSVTRGCSEGLSALRREFSPAAGVAASMDTTLPASPLAVRATVSPPVAHTGADRPPLVSTVWTGRLALTSWLSSLAAHLAARSSRLHIRTRCAASAAFRPASAALRCWISRSSLVTVSKITSMFAVSADGGACSTDGAPGGLTGRRRSGGFNTPSASFSRASWAIEAPNAQQSSASLAMLPGIRFIKGLPAVDGISFTSCL